MVVLVHTRFALPSTPQAEGVAGYILYPMAMGVDLFFIISGFLMVITTRNFDNTRSYMWTFFSKRLARIWPVYAFTSAVAMMVMYHGLKSLKHMDVVLPFLEGLLFIPHDPAHNHMYFSMAVDVSWTLCFEMYFYLVFTASMLFGRLRYMAIMVWFALTLIAVPYFMGNLSINPALQPTAVEGFRYASVAMNPIIWDFVYGMVIAWIYLTPAKAPSWVIYSIMIVSILSLIMFWDDLGMGNFYGPFAWGAPLAIGFLGVAMLSKNAEIKVPEWTVWLGGISYSLYLTHIYTFMLADRVIDWINPVGRHVEVARIVLRPMASILVAYGVYLAVENRFSKIMLRWLTGRKVASPVQPLM